PRTTATIRLAPGQRDMTWDAGYYKCIDIGDLVWYDINKNDIWDTNENGINGLKINLWKNHFGTWLIWDFKYTGQKPGSPSDDGYFNFCAPPGQYYIQVIMPPLGLVRARANIGSNRLIDSDLTNANGPGTTPTFVVRSGESKKDVGAGFYPMGTVGNLVWMDSNLNGIQESNEAKVQGVKVEAIDISNGTTFATSVTNGDGVYNLEYLEKQSYYLKFTPPSGFIATVPYMAPDDMDSDVDHSFGPNTTRLIEVQPSMQNENIDMGIAFGVLPVDWVDVSAARVDNQHVITWIVASEINVSHYLVERKVQSDSEFKAIPGKIDAVGNSNARHTYHLADVDVDRSGTYIYRVKQVDLDGRFTYSKSVKLTHQGSNSIDIYPNPAKNETNVQLELAQDAMVKIELYDATAKLVNVIRNTAVEYEGSHMYNLNLENIQPGVYNIVFTIDGVKTQKKLIRIE
ncbi:MAG: SdrD B-like domain-containing protein, partial [Saprospiraceae bacterium]